MPLTMSGQREGECEGDRETKIKIDSERVKEKALDNCRIIPFLYMYFFCYLQLSVQLVALGVTVIIYIYIYIIYVRVVGKYYAAIHVDISLVSFDAC